MSYVKSFSGLFIFVLFICCSCKRNEVTSSSAIFPTVKDSLSVAAHDSIPRVAVYTSSDYGNSWQPMSTGLPDNVQGTCIEKMGHELILATENAGLFMTENNKSSWKDIGKGLPSKKINTLYVSGDEIYIGLYHEGVTMWKLNSPYWNSYNNNLPNRNVLAIVKVKDELVVGTDMGIFKSSGHIQSWTGKHIGEQCVSLNISGDTLYAGTVKGVMMSKDSGETWAYIQKGGAIHTTILQERKIFASYTSGDLYMSDNWGRTWNKIAYSPREQTFVYSLVNAVDQLIMSNGYGVFHSATSANKWDLIYPEKNYSFVDFAAHDHVVFGATKK